MYKHGNQNLIIIQIRNDKIKWNCRVLFTNTISLCVCVCVESTFGPSMTTSFIHEVNLTLAGDCKSKGECSFWLHFCCFWSWIFHLFQFSIPLYHYSVCVTLQLLIRFILNLNKMRKEKKIQSPEKLTHIFFKLIQSKVMKECDWTNPLNYVIKSSFSILHLAQKLNAEWWFL